MQKYPSWLDPPVVFWPSPPYEGLDKGLRKKFRPSIFVLKINLLIEILKIIEKKTLNS